MKDEALRLALEALESSEAELLKARAKIKQALKQSVVDSDTSQKSVAEIEKTQHMKDEALRLVLEAIEICAVRQEHQWYGLQLVSRAKAAAKQALEQPEPKPVVFVFEGAIAKWNLPEKFTGFLYTAPPKRKPLTDEEFCKFWRSRPEVSLIRAIERAHGIKEKNT